jgi:RNA polymerase sigma-70 factor (ECF subfamily)
MMINEALAPLKNEPALISREKADPAEFEAIYEFYFARVYNYARYRVLDGSTADDLTSDIFETVLARLHTYDPERGPFAPWLFGIARNKVNYFLRREKIRKWLSLEQLQHLAGKGPAPVEIAIKNESYRQLLEAVSVLDGRERELIALKFTAGLTNRTISEMTGLKENHVAVILHRAVKRIRAQLEILDTTTTTTGA